MANQLAKQMLNNLAEKAGQNIGQEHKTVNQNKSRVNVNQQEEQMLIELIHLRNKLYPDKPLVTENAAKHNHDAVSDSTYKMVSLSELAGKSR